MLLATMIAVRLKMPNRTPGQQDVQLAAVWASDSRQPVQAPGIIETREVEESASRLNRHMAATWKGP